jgi:hypothetical protein
MRIKSLMSTVEAAGYAMAPSEDDMADYVCQLPDDALRHGHDAAAQKPLFAAPYIQRDRAIVVVEPGRVHQYTHRSHWLRDFIANMFAPNAHA